MAYSDLRTALVALLNAVTNIGQVHNRERWADDWPTFLDLFKTTIGSTDQVRGWMVSREAVVPEIPDSREASVMYRHDFVIVGVLGFQDGGDTDGTFQALVDSVIDKLNADKNLGGFAIDWGQGPAQARRIELRTFGRVLCHYAEIAWPVRTTDQF